MRWRKRRYRCQEATCPRRAFSESVTELPPGARVSGRLCRAVAAPVASGQGVASVAAHYQVSWPVVHRHFAEHADVLLTEPASGPRGACVSIHHAGPRHVCPAAPRCQASPG